MFLVGTNFDDGHMPFVDFRRLSCIPSGPCVQNARPTSLGSSLRMLIENPLQAAMDRRRCRRKLHERTAVGTVALHFFVDRTIFPTWLRSRKKVGRMTWI